MKMLLTANGVQNSSIKAELEKLMAKPFSESRVGYIPTATFVEYGDHSWMIDSLNRLYRLGWKEFNILDLNGTPKSNLTMRLADCDVIFVEGGNVYHLANSILVNDLTDTFMNALQEKVYVGSSAGSMIFSKYFNEESAKLFGEMAEFKELSAKNISSPFNLFDWYLKPHVNSPNFPERTNAWIKDISRRAVFPIYALDDESAVVINGNNLKVISEGVWGLYLDGART